MKRIRGMSLQLLKLLFLGGVCAVSFLALVSVCSDLLIRKYFSGSALQRFMTEQRIESFRDLVARGGISTTDTEKLMEWCEKQPMILMEVYRDNLLYFNSAYLYPESLSDQNIDAIRYDWYSYYEVQFADGPGEVFVYSDESYILMSWILILAVTLSGVLFIAVVMAGIRKAIRYIYTLCDEIQIMGSGNLEHPIPVRGHTELGLLAKELDQMRTALLFHRQNEQYMLRQNNEIISSLSHDFRTPLTKLLLFIEIIENRKYEDEDQLLLYLSRIRDNALQMKRLSEHLLRFSLSQGKVFSMEAEVLPYHTALDERLTEMADYLTGIGFTVEKNLAPADPKILVIGYFLNRILDNISSNVSKYAEKALPVVICSADQERLYGFSVSNVRSSEAGQADSSGIGVENIRNMMQQMNGKCITVQEKDRYSVTLLFAVRSR